MHIRNNRTYSTAIHACYITIPAPQKASLQSNLADGQPYRILPIFTGGYKSPGQFVLCNKSSFELRVSLFFRLFPIVSAFALIMVCLCVASSSKSSRVCFPGRSLHRFWLSGPQRKVQHNHTSKRGDGLPTKLQNPQQERH